MTQTWTPAEKQMRQALCDRIKELDRLSFKPTCAEPATLSSLRTALMAMHSVHFCWDISAIDRHEFSTWKTVHPANTRSLLEKNNTTANIPAARSKLRKLGKPKKICHLLRPLLNTS